MAATIAVETSGPTPGIWRRRWHAASSLEMRSISSLICGDVGLQLLPLLPEIGHQQPYPWREVLLGIFEERGIWLRRLAGPLANAMPRSSRNPRIWLMSAVRRCTSRSRTRCIACRSSWSSVLIGTKRMLWRVTASAIASASMKSFLLDLRKVSRTGRE